MRRRRWPVADEWKSHLLGLEASWAIDGLFCKPLMSGRWTYVIIGGVRDCVGERGIGSRRPEWRPPITRGQFGRLRANLSVSNFRPPAASSAKAERTSSAFEIRCVCAFRLTV